MSPRAEHFDHGYVVGVLVNNQMDSPEDEDRLPDVVGATQVRPIFTRVLGQHKHPLREPEHGAHGMLVSSAPIKTGVMKSGHLTSDINPRGEALPDASPGIWLVTGIYNVDFEGHYPSFEIVVTSEHTKENPLDLWSAASDVMPPSTPAQTLLLPAEWSPGDVLGRDPETGELSWLDVSLAPDISGFVQDDDPRLSDAREPTAHSHPEYLTADDVPEFPDLSAFVETDDERLSDARTPLAHEHQIEDVEGLAASLADFQPRGEYLVPGDLPDLSDVVREDDERLSDARTPTEHRHAWSDLDDVPPIPATPEDIGAQPAGDYLTPGDLPEAPDLSDVVREDDPRLADAREPVDHRHDYSDLDGTPAIPAAPEDIGAQPAGDYLTAEDLPAPPDLTDVVRGDDPRLSDARPPTDHRHDYSDLDGAPSIPTSPGDIGAQPAGDYLTAADLPAPPDLSDVVRDDDPRLSDAREPTEHSHPEYLTADDLPDAPDLSDVVRDDDPRLSDARPPTQHNHDDRYYTESEVDTALAGKADTSHQHPVTDLETTGTRDATTYLRGDGAWATPEGGSGGGGPLTGTGFPEGVVTAPVGTEYVDTEATNGAVKWIKATGTGNTGWRVLYGDTGPRDISSLIVHPGMSATYTGAPLVLQRVGVTVFLSGPVYVNHGTSLTTGNILATPEGFRPAGDPAMGTFVPNQLDQVATHTTVLQVWRDWGIYLQSVIHGPTTSGGEWYLQATYLTNDPWPEPDPEAPPWVAEGSTVVTTSPDPENASYVTVQTAQDGSSVDVNQTGGP